ncbi:MAG TPA: hypothetical protein VEL76_42290, partial [Gemmataceae bacterium]|nr:hypothetical protein [Gemmataceae bacterium]
VTFWSWFGTNQLGVGLHAYGFSNTLAMICAVFWVAHLLVIFAALVPLRHWRAFAPAQPALALNGPSPPAKIKAPRPRRRDGGSTGITK